MPTTEKRKGKIKTSATKSIEKIREKKEKDPDLYFHKFKALDGRYFKITLRQQLFSEYYLQYRGNGVDAVIDAGYDVTFKSKKSGDGGINRKLAAVIASQNLTKLNICEYINLKLEEYGFTDTNVEKQHLFLINQYDNLPAKGKAIDTYYKVKGKYPKEVSPITQVTVTDDQLKRILNRSKDK